MRLVIHDFAGHPFQAQLSRELAKRGHDVIHAFSPSTHTPKGALTRRSDDPEGLAFEPIDVGTSYERYSFRNRRRHDISYGKTLASRVRVWRPDVVVSCNTPLDSQRLFADECHRRRVSFIFWVQDLIGLATKRILAKKLPGLGHLVGHHYQSMEKKIARRSDAVISITDGFAEALGEWGVRRDLQHVIHNWADLDEITPASRDNDWARAHDLVDKHTFVYTGTMGLKHNPDLILQLAERFRDRPDVAVVVVSEGLGADWLSEQAAKRNLKNLKLIGFQPYDLLPSVLASAEILLAILDSDSGVFSVPSKVLSYLCAGRAILAAMPRDNLAARLLGEADAGVVVDASDVIQFLESAERLIDDASRRRALAEAGRRYAETHFNIDPIASHFEQVVLEARSNNGTRASA